MKYDFKCKKCEHCFETEMPALTFKEVKEEGLPCEKCDGKAFNVFNPSNLQISFKGVQWADKNYKEKKYRKERSEYLAARQKINHRTPTLIPNYKGEQTGSWKEAKEAARDDGKLDFTYDHLVKKENKSN